MAAPTEFLQYIDSKADAFIQRLADAVQIPSYVHSLARWTSRVAHVLPLYLESAAMLSAEEM